MKSFYITLMLIIALPLSVLSQTAFTHKVVPQSKPNLPAVTKDLENANYFSNHDKDIYPKQLGKYKVIDTTIDVVFNSLYYDNTPLVYEPKSNTLFLVQTNRGLVKSTDDRMTGFIYLYWSQDNGSTWERETIFGKDSTVAKGMVPVNMSLSVTNPTGGSDPSTFNYVVFGRLFQYNPKSKKYDNKGGYYLLNSGKGFDGFEPPYNEEGPLTNNPGTNQIWSGAKMFSSEGNGTHYMFLYGTLSPKPNQQYGMYGFGFVGMKNGGISDLNSFVPDAWGPQKWRQSPNLNSSYNAPLNVDVDEEGTLYAAFNNIFSDDIENRVLGISKSVDNGNTWSAFDRMPLSAITDYLNQYDSKLAFISDPYTSNGFAVTGKNKYSFVGTMVNYTNNNDTLVKFVEISSDNGTWSIKQIGDNSRYLVRLLHDTTDTDVDTVVKEGFYENPRGCEIQLAKTADGQNMVCKYIVNRSTLSALNPVVTLAGGNAQIDSILTTDIYYSYRSLSQSTWSEPKTITNDEWMNKVTWIPNIVPSLTEIPIIEHTTVQFINPANERLKNKYPYWLQNYVTDPLIRNLILLATFNAITGSSVRNESIQVGPGTSVDDQLMPDFKLFDIYPNPVSGIASLSYNLEMPANVKIELYNALGEIVKVISESKSMDLGFFNVSFDVSDLPVGTYYYTLTANGRAITKLMNIIR
jgi:hypothetical protein